MEASDYRSRHAEVSVVGVHISKERGVVAEDPLHLAFMAAISVAAGLTEV